MAYRVLLCLLAVIAASRTVSARKHRRVRPAATRLDRGALKNRIASVGLELGVSIATAPSRTLSLTFLQFHSARVEHDLILFRPILDGMSPTRDGPGRDLFAQAPVKKEERIYKRAEGITDLAAAREVDHMLLFRESERHDQSVAMGIAMFGAMTVLAAHAPRPFRILFDHRVHLGPAIFEGGGVGAGVAGH